MGQKQNWPKVQLTRRALDLTHRHANAERLPTTIPRGRQVPPPQHPVACAERIEALGAREYICPGSIMPAISAALVLCSEAPQPANAPCPRIRFVLPDRGTLPNRIASPPSLRIRPTRSATTCRCLLSPESPGGPSGSSSAPSGSTRPSGSASASPAPSPPGRSSSTTSPSTSHLSPPATSPPSPTASPAVTCSQSTSPRPSSPPSPRPQRRRARHCWGCGWSFWGWMGRRSENSRNLCAGTVTPNSRRLLFHPMWPQILPTPQLLQYKPRMRDWVRGRDILLNKRSPRGLFRQ